MKPYLLVPKSADTLTVFDNVRNDEYAGQMRAALRAHVDFRFSENAREAKLRLLRHLLLTKHQQRVPGQRVAQRLRIF